MNEAKKSRDGDYFLNFIETNKDRLLLKEKERKQAEKLAKKNKKKKNDWGEEEEEEEEKISNENTLNLF